MKISEGQGPISGQNSQLVDKKREKGGGFQKIMDQMLPEKGKGEKGIAPANLGPVAGGVHILHGVEKIEQPLNNVQGKLVMEELKQALDLVDFYGAKLADSSISVKDLSPMVSRLEERLEHLQAMGSDKNLPDKLRPIISDMAITIGTEIAKFKRGDYV